MRNTKPYNKLALIYDKLMSHVNYKLWADYIKNLFQYADINVKTVIDISCGTGSLLTYFKNKKYSCFGSDISYPMISQAQRKTNNALFIVNDVKQMGIKSLSCDAVLFLYDSLNYMHDEKEIIFLFMEVNRILNKGGIFIFDIITDLLCKTHYKNFEEEENWGDYGYFRHSFYNEKEKIQHNDFRITVGKKIFFESHIQKVFLESKIAECINKNKFELIAQLDDFTFQNSNNDSERIHYVCQKKQ
jgi:ubiquinone/menaquinone biosynthesis C-methylase UbiE